MHLRSNFDDSSLNQQASDVAKETVSNICFCENRVCRVLLHVLLIVTLHSRSQASASLGLPEIVNFLISKLHQKIACYGGHVVKPIKGIRASQFILISAHHFHSCPCSICAPGLNKKQRNMNSFWLLNQGELRSVSVNRSDASAF